MTAGLFVVALLVLSLEAASSPFEADEADYVATSRYFGYLFLQHDVTRPEWDSNHWTRTQPPMTRYVVGAWLTIRGYDLEKLNQPYVSSASSFEVNRQKGRVPSDDALAAARQPMVLLGAGAIALLYPLGVLLAGPLGGLFAVALALTSPFLRYTLVHAWAEAPLAFLLLLSALLAALGVRRLVSGGSVIRWGVGLGLALGLMSATKLTGLVGLPIVAVVAGAVLLCRWCTAAADSATDRSPSPDSAASSIARDGRQHLVIGSALAIAVMLLTFVAVNPYLWRGPNVGLAGMLEERQREMTDQQEQWPEFAVYGVGDRLWHTIVGSTRVGPWAELPLPASIVGLSFGALGVVTAARRAWTPPIDRLTVGTLLLWLLAYLGAIFLGLKLSYPRYFLPSCLLLLPFMGAGAAVLVGYLARRGAGPVGEAPLEQQPAEV